MNWLVNHWWIPYFGVGVSLFFAFIFLTERDNTPTEDYDPLTAAIVIPLLWPCVLLGVGIALILKSFGGKKNET